MRIPASIILMVPKERTMMPWALHAAPRPQQLTTNVRSELRYIVFIRGFETKDRDTIFFGPQR